MNSEEVKKFHDELKFREILLSQWRSAGFEIDSILLKIMEKHLIQIREKMWRSMYQVDIHPIITYTKDSSKITLFQFKEIPILELYFYWEAFSSDINSYKNAPEFSNEEKFFLNNIAQNIANEIDLAVKVHFTMDSFPL